MVTQNNSFYITEKSDLLYVHLSKQMCMTEHKSDTIAIASDNSVFNSSCMSDVIMDAVVEEKAFAERKVNEA